MASYYSDYYHFHDSRAIYAPNSPLNLISSLSFSGHHIIQNKEKKSTLSHAVIRLFIDLFWLSLISQSPLFKLKLICAKKLEQFCFFIRIKASMLLYLVTIFLSPISIFGHSRKLNKKFNNSKSWVVNTVDSKRRRAVMYFYNKITKL